MTAPNTAPVTAPIAADGTRMFTAAMYVTNNTPANIVDAAAVDEIFYMMSIAIAPVRTIAGVNWYTGRQSREAHFDRVVGLLVEQFMGISPDPLGLDAF